MQALAADIGRQLAPDLLPDEFSESLLLLYALLAATLGESVEATNVHDAWTVWKTLQGEQDHPATVPFTQLATMTQQEDLPFVTAIRRAASGRSGT